MQLVPTDWVDRAQSNTVATTPDGAKVLGVDVARFGKDKSIICKREINKVHPLLKFSGLDTMQLAARVADIIDEWNPDVTMVDGTGLGAGVVDRLRQLNYNVIDVQFGSRPDDDMAYANKRAEIWGRMKDWLRGDVELPKDPDLKKQLIGLEYGYNIKGQILLEKKEDMAQRLPDVGSPDEADAVAVTFAEPVRPTRHQHLDPRRLRRDRTDISWRLI